jgi:hypothetical protein
MAKLMLTLSSPAPQRFGPHWANAMPSLHPASLEPTLWHRRPLPSMSSLWWAPKQRFGPPWANAKERLKTDWIE